MQKDIIKTVEEAITNAGGIDWYVKELFHQKPILMDEVQRVRISVTVSSNEVNSFLIYMNETFSNIKFSKTGVVMYADNNPLTEEWEIEITFVGDNM